MTICIFVLLLAGLLIAAQKALSTDGAVQVVVTVDGKSYGTYSLKREQVIRIETEYGYNELTIKDGKKTGVDFTQEFTVKIRSVSIPWQFRKTDRVSSVCRISLSYR